MTQYTSAVVTLVDANRDKMSFGSENITFDFDEEDNTYIFVDEKDNELTLEDFAEDDVIAYVANNTKVKEATYVKIIKLSDSVITGKIDSVHSGDKVVTIDDENYEVVSTVWNEDIFTPGAEGTFYIGITGKIVYYDDTKVKSNYGYILATGIDNDSFDNETVIKMLTEDGIDTYYLTDRMETEYATKLAGIKDWVYNTPEAIRFVEYKINSKGLISSLKFIGETDTTNADSINGKYNSDTEMLDRYFIDNNTLVFYIGEADKDDCFVTDMDYFVDEGTYTGAVYTKNGDTKVVFITSTTTKYSNEVGFAIVTGTSVMTKNDETVFAVDYVQNETEGTIYFEDYDYDDGKAIFGNGTVFAFKADAKGYVKIKDYEIIAKVNNYIFVDEDGDAIAKGIVVGPGEDVDVVFGTIDNTSRKTNSRGELITIGSNTYVITSKTNKYTYDSTRYKSKIETEDFLSGNAYYGSTTPVMLKLVDGVVVDIYTISPKDAD